MPQYTVTLAICIYIARIYSEYIIQFSLPLFLASQKTAGADSECSIDRRSSILSDYHPSHLFLMAFEGFVLGTAARNQSVVSY